MRGFLTNGLKIEGKRWTWKGSSEKYSAVDPKFIALLGLFQQGMGKKVFHAFGLKLRKLQLDNLTWVCYAKGADGRKLQ